MTATQRWNHNIHYHRVILDALPAAATTALDVGCGDGNLSRLLAEKVQRVVAIDSDGPSIQSAIAHDGAETIDYVLGDFLTHFFDPASFDVIVSVATLHHMDAREALKRMAQLLRPGGTLVVLGLARRRLPHDLAYELAAVIACRAHSRFRTHWEHPSPKVWPPPQTYAESKRIAAECLPGVSCRRHLYWRYSLTWTKPVSYVDPPMSR